MTVHIALVITLIVLGGLQIVASRIRTARDVVADLDLDGGDAYFVREGGKNGVTKKLIIDDELGKIGLFTPAARREFLLAGRLYPIIGAVLFVLVSWFNSGANPLIPALLGFCVGYFVHRRRFRTRRHLFIKEIEFYIPLVMENVVMAVEAGLDVIAALKSVVAFSSGRIGLQGAQVKVIEMDPVSRLLEIVCQMAESGVGFDEALRHVADAIDCGILRHCFIHLGVAFKEGGELITPLRELSNSTQAYYQETVEEDIAKMPVKAMAPLMCTFVGLIITFLAPPLLQVMTLLKGGPKP